MSRFARPASEAGIIEPRSGPTPPASRSASRATFARLVGAAGMIALTALLYWLLTDPSFRVTGANIEVAGLQHADEDAVRSQLSGLERAPNAFRVRASDIVAKLGRLPEVTSASATVTLPGNVSVRVAEREPIFIWSDGKAAWFVDREGLLFAPAPRPRTTSAGDAAEQSPEDEGREGEEPGSRVGKDAESSAAGAAPSGPPVPSGAEASDGAGTSSAAEDPAGAGAPPAAEGSPLAADASAASAEGGTPAAAPEVGAAGLPVVVDERLSETPPTIGSHLPAIDLQVMRQLLALTPELIESRASELRLRIDPLDGYVLSSDRFFWKAIFGHYMPTLHPPSNVPRQVQCLRWLLADGERQLESVRLAVAEPRCGTFTEFGQKEKSRDP